MQRKKQTPQYKDAQEHPNGPYRSSLMAFLISLFSCSKLGVRCGDDPKCSQAVNDDKAGRQHVASTSRMTTQTRSQKRVQEGAAHLPILQASKVDADARRHVDYNSENEQQLLTQNDLKGFDKGLGLPQMSEASLILSENLRGSICPCLPQSVQGCQWVLLYSTWKHGISLLTLYRKSGRLTGPRLLVVEDSKGTIFGSLLSSPLNPTKNHKFQGTNESFVFSNVLSEFKLFRPTGVNRYFYLCTNEMLACGGGSAFALHLVGDLLHGSSGCSETYGNCCLAHAEEFAVRNVELWGFVPAFKYQQKNLSSKVQQKVL